MQGKTLCYLISHWSLFHFLHIHNFPPFFTRRVHTQRCVLYTRSFISLTRNSTPFHFILEPFTLLSLPTYAPSFSKHFTYLVNTDAVPYTILRKHSIHIFSTAKNSMCSFNGPISSRCF